MSKYPVPREIIGEEALKALLDAGFRVVPCKANDLMRSAAVAAMGKHRKAIDDQSLWVTDKEKAGIRWEAMLSAWKGDQR